MALTVSMIGGTSVYPPVVGVPAGALRVECSWCSKVMQDGPPAPVSHGICGECAKDFA